jgi:4-amino-4-deoxy-L-arabinose transferase-like glycosyltransferase
MRLSRRLALAIRRDYAPLRVEADAVPVFPLKLKVLQLKCHAGLLAIVAIAVLFRLPSLLNDGLWRDEANVYVDLIAPTFGEFLHRVTAVEWHPPLFFFIAYLWAKAVGTTELTLKFLPFIFSIMTVPVVYRLGREASSSRTGLLAAAMYATAPLAISYSTEYLYPLMGLLCTLLAWLVMHARRQQRLTIAQLIVVGLVTLLTAYTHYVAMFYVPMLMLWALFSRNGIRHGIALVSALVVGVLPFVFWLPVFLNQRHIGVPYFLGMSAWDKVSFFNQTLLQCVPASPLVLLTLFLYLIAVAFFALTRSRSLRSDPCVLALIFLSVLVLILAENLVAVRYVVPFYGLLCVFFAWVIAEATAYVQMRNPLAWHRGGVQAVIALFALVLVGNAAFAFGNSAVPKSGIRSLVRAGPLDRSALYVIAPDYDAPTFAFYARDAGVASHGFVRWSHPEIFRLDGYAKDWSTSDAVDGALGEMARESRHYKYLDVLVDEYAHDQGRVFYGKVWQLLNRLERRYRLVSYTRYPGRYEPISEYRFLIPRPQDVRSRPSLFRT